MIILRTKHFGFYDQSGKLLEKYAKGGKFNNKFQKWKNNILEQYQEQLRSHGLDNKLSKEEVEEILREQSRARDTAANIAIRERKDNLKYAKNSKDLAEKYRKEADAATDKSLKDYLNNMADDHESSVKRYLSDRRNDSWWYQAPPSRSPLVNRKRVELQNTGDFNNRNRKYGPGQLLKEEVENSTGYVDQVHLDSFTNERKHKAWLEKRAQERQQEEAIKNSDIFKNQQQATVDAQNANQKLQENLNNSNKQINDLTAQNQFLQQQQGIHAKNYNDVVNQNKDLTNKNKDLNNKYNASVEENKRQAEKYTQDMANKDAEISKGQKKNKELEDSKNNWKYAAYGLGGLGLAGTAAAIYAARKNRQREEEEYNNRYRR